MCQFQGCSLIRTLNKIGFLEMIVKSMMLTQMLHRRQSDLGQGLYIPGLNDNISPLEKSLLDPDLNKHFYKSNLCTTLTVANSTMFFFSPQNHVSQLYSNQKKKYIYIQKIVPSLVKNTIIHSENSKEKLSNTRLSTKPYDLWLASY